MKNARKENQNLGKRNDVNRTRPENKDNLDSRERKEAGYRQEDDDTSKADKQKSKRP